jgi:tRNA pseudouridine38-40 synthase
MKNIKLIIAYNGTSYNGWQKTSIGLSIEESLRSVLELILQHKIVLQAASRTDAGVHARGQVVNFFTGTENLQLKRLHYSLNQLLPSDIVVLDLKEEIQEFHPTLDCKQKEYHYFVCTDQVQLPEHRFYSWHCSRLQRTEVMRQAAKFLVGEHDFSAFCNYKKHQHYDSYVRDVKGIDIEDLPKNRLIFKIRGRNFLYKMVRNIVGTLAYVGMGELNLAQIPVILASHDRKQAGITAPSHGLFLHQVMY